MAGPIGIATGTAKQLGYYMQYRLVGVEAWYYLQLATIQIDKKVMEQKRADMLLQKDVYRDVGPILLYAL